MLVFHSSEQPPDQSSLSDNVSYMIQCVNKINQNTIMLMPRWKYPMHYCGTHNTIAKTHADCLESLLGHLGRQSNKAAVGAFAHRKWQCKHCTNIIGCVPNCISPAFNCMWCTSVSLVRLRSFGCLILWISLRLRWANCATTHKQSL